MPRLRPSLARWACARSGSGWSGCAIQEGLGNDLEVAQAGDRAGQRRNRGRRHSWPGICDQLANAIAILVGANPASFRLPARRRLRLPSASSGDLPRRAPPPICLERSSGRRRSGKHAARRCATAKIGIAKAAFFPVLTLTGSGGYLSSRRGEPAHLGQPHLVAGPQPLPAGLRRSGRRSHANYERALARRPPNRRPNIVNGFWSRSATSKNRRFPPFII